MKHLLTINGEHFSIILKSKPERSKMFCFAEFKCGQFFRFDCPVIELHNSEIPYGIPTQVADHEGKKKPIVKFVDGDGDWLMVGGDKKSGIPHKFLTSSSGRFIINQTISRYILKNPTLFGLPTTKIDLAKEPTTDLISDVCDKEPFKAREQS